MPMKLALGAYQKPRGAFLNPSEKIGPLMNDCDRVSKELYTPLRA